MFCLQFYKQLSPCFDHFGGHGVQAPTHGDRTMVAHSSQPVSERCRLWNVSEIQHGSPGLIVLEVPTVIQMNAAFVLHQEQGFDERRWRQTPVALR